MGFVIPKWYPIIGSPSTPTFTASRLGYAFSYDKLNRLLGAETYNASNSKTGNYDELVSYDVMGNITSLSRNAVIGGVKKQIDNLAYTYKRNQLTQVDDGSADVTGLTIKCSKPEKWPIPPMDI